MRDTIYPRFMMWRGTCARSPWTLPLLAFAIYEVAYIALYLALPHTAADPAFSDFYAFWAYANYAHTHPVAAIYDLDALRAFEQALRPGFEGFYAFPYPPIFLLYLWPLGWIGFWPAFVGWIGGTLSLYLTAVGGGTWRAPRVALALVAPTTLFAIIFGQNSLLTAALMIGGFRLLRRAPVLGGLLLGGLAFKPQFFVLIPVALLAARQWRALAGVAAGVVGLGLVSILAFGADSWLAWVRTTPDYWPLFESQRARLLHMVPTVTAGLMEMGIATRVAQIAQTVVSLSVMVCLWLLFRRGARACGAPRPMDVAALQVAVFLVTPYAFVYDMPIVTSAVAVVIECCLAAGRPWRSGERTVLIGALLLPVAMLGGVTAGTPVGPLVLGALLALILRMAWNMPAEAAEAVPAARLSPSAWPAAAGASVAAPVGLESPGEPA